MSAKQIACRISDRFTKVLSFPRVAFPNKSALEVESSVIPYSAHWQRRPCGAKTRCLSRMKPTIEELIDIIYESIQEVNEQLPSAGQISEVAGLDPGWTDRRFGFVRVCKFRCIGRREVRAEISVHPW